MTQFRYTAVEVRQRPDGKPFYLMEASATDILQWSAVPRKKQEFQLGYQRKLDERHEGIRDFLKHDPSNIVPTAVLIAATKNLRIEDCVTTEEGNQVHVPGVKQVVFEISDVLTDDEKLKAAYDDLFNRLNDKERDFVTSGLAQDLSILVDDDAIDEDSPLPPESYVAVIAKELRSAIMDRTVLAEGRYEVLLDYANLVQLPGMILDGQHRVFGAKLVNSFDAKLPVVLLTETSVAEQAFQFYVVNNKATKLTPTELRGTISTSLTAKEIEELYDRFKQAGVSADTARWTHMINTDGESPFNGLIDFGFQKGFLKENVMFQVVSAFMRPKRGLKSVFQSVQSWDDDGYRMMLFYAFWRKISDLYPNAWAAAVASKGGQLLMKATMLVLQKYLFERFAANMPARQRKGEPSPVSTVDELERSIADELYYLPEEFFTRSWSRTDLDTSDGRAMLLEQVQKVVQNLGKNVANFQLFKQSKSDAVS